MCFDIDMVLFDRSDLHLQSSIELERNKNHSIPRKDTLLELSLSF